MNYLLYRILRETIDGSRRNKICISFLESIFKEFMCVYEYEREKERERERERGRERDGMCMSVFVCECVCM